MYENDFIPVDIVEVNVKGRPFKLRILNGEEADRLDSKYTHFDAIGTMHVDSAEKNKEFLPMIVIDAPYEKAGRKWSELTKDEKLDILQNLRPEIRNGIFGAYNSAVKLTEEEAKK